MVDLEEIIDSTHLDRGLLTALLDASTNLDIARALDRPWFHLMLDTLIADRAGPTATKTAAQDLLNRIKGWTVLLNALENPNAPFDQAVAAVEGMTASENNCGAWLIGMITNPDLIDHLPHDGLVRPPPKLLGNPALARQIKHGDFLLFLRAIVGVASVLAAYAWSDAWPDTRCRERCLGILKLWQSVEGYPEVSLRFEC